MGNQLLELHATFKGSVQGVGFRVTARHNAMRLGIVGTVRNLADGSVELYALGKPQAVKELLKVLSAPNGAGKVAAVFSEEVLVHHSYADFKII